MADLLENGARTGVQPWARLHAEGHGEHWTAAADYIERNLGTWRRALRFGKDRGRNGLWGGFGALYPWRIQLVVATVS